MPPGTPYSEGPAEPAAAAGALAESLISAALAVAIGAAAGLLLARLMRATQIHWSWAALACALILLAAPTSGGFALTALTATLLAALSTARAHRADARGGGDLAHEASMRVRPLDVLMRAAVHVVPAAGRAGAAAPARLQVGRDERGRAVTVPFGPSLAVHTLVVGATGSGKTVTQTQLAIAAIDRGMGVLAVDPKGDSDLRAALTGGARDAGRRFLEWTPAGGSVYNPFASGGASEIADKALAGERFTEPHYMRQAQRYLGHVVRTLRGAGVEVCPRSLAAHMDPDRLDELARGLTGASAAGTHEYLATLTSRQRADLAGVRDRLAILVESDVGPWLDPATTGAERLNLLEAVRARDVVYVALQADSRPLLMQMLGGAIVQDLQSATAALQAEPVPTLALIDEFSALASEQVVRLFGRARSAGVSVVLGTQELSDLRLAGQERTLERVLGNVSVVLAHRQGVPDSAEMIARMAGTRGVWSVSRRSDGGEARSRAREGVLEPSTVMSLRPGWAAVIVLGSGTARVTRVRRASSRA
jgi:type IV secretory pathway TraG/TraD family ATPase VirD4